MELRQVERMARKYGSQLGGRVDAASRALKPYRKQALQMTRDLRPLGKQLVGFVKKYPGGTVAGALVVGYLLAALRRR